MAHWPGTDDGMLISPTLLRDPSVKAGDVDMDSGEGAAELSLEEILGLYSQPINEEQAWAVCYQCCRTLALTRRGRKSAEASSGREGERRIDGPGDVRIQRDGTVILQHQDTSDLYTSAHTSLEVIESLGLMIYKALDYGLKDSEERELSAPLEQLIDLMTKVTDAGDSDLCPDEGYEATEEEEESEADEGLAAHGVGSVRGYRDIIVLCSSHLPSPSDAPDHYQAVCRALYAETRELGTFLEKIKNAKENLRKMGGERWEEPVKELDDLQNADWMMMMKTGGFPSPIGSQARFWVQVMRDLRNGVKLKKVQERQYNPLPIEFQLTPYEMLMDDIRSKRYTLRKVLVNGDIPPRLKKSAHDVILDFIRSRPPLNPAAARKLKPHPPQPSSLHERLLAGIKAERKLRPVSPDMVRRHRLVARPLCVSCSFDSSGAGKSISTPQDLCRGSDTPDAPRKLAGSTHSLANGLAGSGGGGAAAQSQRKRLLHAPTLAELDSSESDEDATQSSSRRPTSMASESHPGRKKVPPNFLPISSINTPGQQQSSPRRHSMEKPSPTAAGPFLPLCRQSSKSLEEFGFPVECLALTVEEVMHIRQVLVKAELEKFQQYKEIYTALKKGKLCFSCRTKRFSLFTWSYNCQFCKRTVCSQCCRKMRLPSKPYCTLPIYSLGPSAMSKEDASGAAPSSSSQSDRTPFGSGHNRHSLRRTVSKLSKQSSREGRSLEEPELPRELTEDWATMEVCVDCKKFITEIISSSRRSLSVATKRARLNRKTQSFYLSSAKSTDFRPAERTINEV
ncbi:protein spire homolog 1 isoform X4 [Gadus macrocephalus]|uniref:protein spire homolog 1 isoform X4 n=1 Tax=Gadus macrocephalus TaxID=80720 RepID=UPI0028CB4E2E|nr:protein spire homolog 1 isoform X4 [Gadus macrocephalus]